VRVLVTGMGGQLGTRVAQLLEARADVDEVVGLDAAPPRRQLRRASFRHLDPADADAVAAFTTDVAPDVVAHLGVEEPHGGASPRTAAERARVGTEAVIAAAAATRRLARVVVRSGIEVYGRGRAHPSVPAEDAPTVPGSPFGRSCLHVEEVAFALGRVAGFPVVALRFAPVVGSHAPSPLGRLLRLPVVPVCAYADPPFSVVHTEDAAEAVVAAVVGDANGPVNVVGVGAATPWQAVRLGGRVPVPVGGPGWALAGALTELAGAPVPPHVGELLRHGRTADGSLAADVLGLRDLHHTQAALAEVFEWASVTPLRAAAVA